MNQCCSNCACWVNHSCINCDSSLYGQKITGDSSCEEFIDETDMDDGK